MFERYTERARRTLFFARFEASQLGSLAIEPEHLLLGLLRENTGVTAKVLARAKLSPADIQREIEKRPAGVKASTQIEIPFSAPAKLILRQAAAEADALGHPHIGTEHLLLALLAQRDAGAAAVPLEGLTIEQAREDVARFHEETPLARGDLADTSGGYREARTSISQEARGGPPDRPRIHKPDIPPSYVVHISPTTQPAGTRSTSGPTHWAAFGFTLRAALAQLYAIGESCIVLPPAIDAQARFDIAVVLPNIESHAVMDRLVQEGIERHFRFTLALEPHAMDVYALTADASRPRAAESGLGAISMGLRDRPGPNEWAMMEQFMEVMKASAGFLSGAVDAGADLYVRKVHDLPEPMLQQLRERFGVVATPGRREGLMLIATAAPSTS